MTKVAKRKVKRTISCFICSRKYLHREKMRRMKLRVRPTLTMAKRMAAIIADSSNHWVVATSKPMMRADKDVLSFSLPDVTVK